jgi:hypothetical protein
MLAHSLAFCFLRRLQSLAVEQTLLGKVDVEGGGCRNVLAGYRPQPSKTCTVTVSLAAITHEEINNVYVAVYFVGNAVLTRSTRPSDQEILCFTPRPLYSVLELFMAFEFDHFVCNPSFQSIGPTIG